MSKTRKWYARALYLVFALALAVGVVVPAEVMASPDVSNVRVELSNYADNQPNVTYYIYFTPSVDLTADVDTITVFFPTGTGNITAASPIRVDRDGDAVVYTNVVAPTVTSTGHRIAILTPVNISAGTEARVEIVGIRNPDITTTTKDYTLNVYTSKETTQVASSAYTIGLTSVIPVAFNPADATPAADNGTAGAIDDYLISFRPNAAGSGNLTAGWHTISVVFPADVTVPSSISASYVEVNPDFAGPGAFIPCATDRNPTVSGNTVTLTTPVAVVAGNVTAVRFLSGAGIENPTLATDVHNKVAHKGNYVGKVYTSLDVGVQRKDFTQAIEAVVPASVLGFASTTVTTVPVSTTSGDITVYSLDQYGNRSVVLADVKVLLSSSSGTGLFNGDTKAPWGTLEDVWTSTSPYTYIPANSYQGIFQYKDTTAGIATITASYGGWTSATWDINVTAKGVELFDGTTSLGTYATIAEAITEALSTNTIKVAPGTYRGLLGTIPVTKDKLTIESTGSAADTIIDGYTTGACNVTTVNGPNVTIKGFTIKNSKSTSSTDILVGANADKLALEDCVFDLTANAVKDIGVDVGSVTGVSIKNCTFNVKGTDDGINISGAATSLAITGCSFTGVGGYGYVDAVGGGTTTFTNCTFDGTKSGLDLDSATCDVVVNGCTFKNGSSTTEGAIDTSTVAALTTGKLWVYGSTFENNTGYSLDTVSGAKIVAIFSNFVNNTGGMKATAGALTADHNWWGDASGPTVATNPAGTGDIVSATFVNYDNYLGASVSGAGYADTTSLDAKTTAGVKVSQTGATAWKIGAARYTSKPATTTTPEFTVLENGYFDVYYTYTGTPTVVAIKFYDSAITSGYKAYFWDVFTETWKLCNEQTTTSGMVWVKARPYDPLYPERAPTIDQLADTPFAIGTVGVVLESISATPESKTLSVGETQAITVTATYSDASTADVTATSTYVSDNEAVATVSSAGVITAVAEGSATITVSYTYGGVTKSDTVSVTVTAVVTIEDQLADIADYVQMVYYFDNATKTWSYYWPGVAKTLDVLTTDSPYWINVSADCTIDGIALYAGWNLIVW